MPTAHQTNVFVSSVYKELIPYRKAALDAIWRCDLYPLGMEREDYAMPYSISESSRHMVDEATVYVGIFSHRYGVVTAEELHRAQERGIPILPFIATEPLNGQDQEPDPELARLLEKLKQELRDEYVVASFTSVEELGTKVYRSLVAMRDDGRLPPLESETKLSGRDVAVIPTPPTPYYAHPYLLGGSGFVGRRIELAHLDAWARASEPVLLVEAIGGAGKSALTWEWVQTHLDRALPKRAGVVWWSFYESDATMGAFLTRILAYLTDRPEAACVQLSRPQQEEQVLAVLAQRQVVLVLDGLERLLVAYHRMDAAQLADTAAEAAVEAQPRACTDPRDGAFLRALTRCTASKILITSRLLPTDLQDRAGQLLQGVRQLPLSGLTAEDAIALMEHTGIFGARELMRTVLGQFGDHALLVQVLAGRIRAYRPAPGDFDRWYQDEGQHIQLDAQDLTARRTSILDAALRDVDPAIFRFLCQMAAFRYPVDYAALVALNPFTELLRGEPAPPSRPRISGEEQARSDAEAALARLHRALSELEERGLVQWDRQHNRYDLHPVVRAFAYARLQDKGETLARLRSYFEALPAEDEEQVQEVTDLRRTLEIYHALVESGLFDQALELYHDRLSRLLLYALGAYTMTMELLTPLFPHGLAAAPALTSPRAQSYAANHLAMAFNHLGDLAQAQALFGVCIHLNLQERDAVNLGIAVSNLGQSLRDEGRHLAAAERALLLAEDLAIASADQRGQDDPWGNLMGLYARTGAWEAGEAASAALQASPEEDIKHHAFATIYSAQLRFGQGKDATAVLDEALTQARIDRFPHAECEARRLQGEVALARGDLAGAEEAWQAALAIAKHQSQPLGSYLADLARVRARQGQATLARELIAEAVAQGGQRVTLAAAEVALALGDTTQAAQYTLPAYTDAWADGPPYAQALELERARAVLQALQIPEPHLPAFDPATVAPLPYETEIRTFIAELYAEKAKSEEPDPAMALSEIEVDADAEGSKLEPAAIPSGSRHWWAPWTWKK